MISYEQEMAMRLIDAMTAAQSSLLAQGQRASGYCIQRALDELDTASAAEIARMIERNARVA
jgi:hypothetical protein